jgi:hypothetical protein
MRPSEAGRNAAKAALYYALQAPLVPSSRNQALLLYNCFSYGHALGAAFRGPDGSRRMIWPEDFREIQQHGSTKDGGRLSENEPPERRDHDAR